MNFNSVFHIDKILLSFDENYAFKKKKDKLDYILKRKISLINFAFVHIFGID